MGLSAKELGAVVYPSTFLNIPSRRLVQGNFTLGIQPTALQPTALQSEAQERL